MKHFHLRYVHPEYHIQPTQEHIKAAELKDRITPHVKQIPIHRPVISLIYYKSTL